MSKRSNLSENLRAFQQQRCITQAEFAQAMNVPKSTLQAIMLGGNTTLETLIRLADALNITLDTLVFDENLPQKIGVIGWLLTGVSWYEALPEENKEKLQYHLGEIMELLRCKDKCDSK